MASILVNSLKRLYKAGRITKEQVAERVEKGTINVDDYQTITGEGYSEATADADSMEDTAGA